MATSASEYYAQAQNYKDSADYYSEKISSYTSFNNKLNNFKKSVITCKNYLQDGQTNFKKGGYIANGESFDEINLTKAIDSLDESVENLENIIEKTKMCIEDFVDEKDKYNRLYQEAYNKYLNASKA